jgi:hypothetical protein
MYGVWWLVYEHFCFGVLVGASLLARRRFDRRIASCLGELFYLLTEFVKFAIKLCGGNKGAVGAGELEEDFLD